MENENSRIPRVEQSSEKNYEFCPSSLLIFLRLGVVSILAQSLVVACFALLLMSLAKMMKTSCYFVQNTAMA